MTCPSCGSSWWVEHREIQPAGDPRALGDRHQLPARAIRYRLCCADCGHPALKRSTETKTKPGAQRRRKASP